MPLTTLPKASSDLYPLTSHTKIPQHTGDTYASGDTYAFFPQIEAWYQFRQVLKYFFLVPIICWRAHILGLKKKRKGVAFWGQGYQGDYGFDGKMIRETLP